MRTKVSAVLFASFLLCISCLPSWGDPPKAKGGSVVPNWMFDGNSFWYVDGSPKNKIAYKVDPVANTVEELFDIPKIRAAIAEELGFEPLGLGLPFQKFEFTSENIIRFYLLDGGSYILNLEDYSLREMPEEDEGSVLPETYAIGKAKYTPQWFLREPFLARGKWMALESLSPDGQWLLGVEDDNLYLRATVDGLKVPLTTDGHEYSEWDVDTSGYYPWAPNGKRFVVARMDSSGMARIPTIQYLKPHEQVFPNASISIAAGAPQQRAQLYVMDVHARVPIPVEQDQSEFYYYRVLSWLLNSEAFLVARYTRLFDRLDIQLVNGKTGKVNIVYTETSDTFLTSYTRALSGPRTALGTTVLPDGSGFIQVSIRDGWRHLYLYDLNGKNEQRLTGGDFSVYEVVRLDPQNGWIYFTAQPNQSRPYDVHLCRVSYEGMHFQQLTEGDGQHTTFISPSNNYFVDIYSSVSEPPRTVLRTTDGKFIRTLSEADISGLEDSGWWTRPREVVVKAADGETDIWVTMDLPANFDPTKKYPVVEFIYGGQFITIRRQAFHRGRPTSFRGSRYELLEKLQDAGFIVISMDSRGTPERSHAYLTDIYHKSDVIIDDHAAAIRQLADRFTFFDIERVGITGGSLGGYYSTRALIQAPNEYKVAVSRVPAYDVYASRYREYFLGLPQDNSELYEQASVINKARLLKGKLLMVTGTNDAASTASTFKMSDALVQAGIKHDMFVFTDTRHGPSGVRWDYYVEMAFDFFVEHLKR